MARRCFFSFHFANDAWRASQVRNMGVVDSDYPITDNAWEEVKRGGDSGIKKWIDNQLANKSCAVVLIGQSTASRPWIQYEIARAWNLRKGVVGIHIHKLKNSSGDQCSKGANPFSRVDFLGGTLADIVECYDPSFETSTYVYDDIKNRLPALIENAINIRNRY